MKLRTLIGKSPFNCGRLINSFIKGYQSSKMKKRGCEMSFVRKENQIRMKLI